MEPFDPSLIPAPAPAPTPAPARSGGLRRAVIVMLALLVPCAVLALVVLGGGTDRVDLAAAADRTEAVDSLRFEMVMSFSGEGQHFEFPMMRGEEVGERSHMVMDLQGMNEVLGAEALPGDVGMEMYSVDGVLYLRAPMFAALGAEDVGSIPSAVAPLVELGDRWGVADIGATGATPEEVAALTGSTGLDLATGLELLRSAADDLEASGTGEVRGVPVTEYDGNITFADMFEAQGGDTSMLEGMLPPDLEGLDPSALVDAIASVELDLEVAVDDDGLVRRVAFGIDRSFFEAMAEEMGAPAGEPMPDLEMTMAIEVFDLDDPSISVELPVIEDPVDLNPWAMEMAERFGG